MTAVQALAATPALIGLDWGTTAMRAYLFDAQGNVIATRASGEGIMRLPQPGAFDAAFDAACGDWLALSPNLPVIAAGMIGSAQGWREAPYIETPADAAALVAGIVRVTAACGACVHIVPGVIEHGELPNVMRGEETQIVGALASAAIDGDTRALVGLPGTHAKWAVVSGERIESFHTFMTGELYGALREHTILGRTMIQPSQFDTEAFLRGVTVARHAHQAGLLATIFSTRTLGLTGVLQPEQQPDYLSGLLIGHELCGLAGLLESRGAALAGESPRLIGSAALCERYRLALTQFGCLRASVVEAAAESGLWRIATQAGLVARHAFEPAG
ncbi:2-dehydro-3-deoxygalactonokinase [Trinickia soli]|uniref:2-dehydro-3-deoxygalactonokinase n=1 Tax=Trinickia soli TaxID=380675 RepID=A0A2N7W8M7_9BURK|nr:2-dehydro-3-deoxygalactonokinase [Trinickia soli]KAA0081598.1 2-dehydro-3-deoxygalactonokinase [Paraburkholderia sp. T12-10]PMS25763.1 2-dehydro-3-deoxygalactonokinase [Trinickia soli]CAB3641471.1 putative 2-dehydro-3-deoxygalactonokinase DgoK1 [Trinickia soli]